MWRSASERAAAWHDVRGEVPVDVRQRSMTYVERCKPTCGISVRERAAP